MLLIVFVQFLAGLLLAAAMPPVYFLPSMLCFGILHRHMTSLEHSVQVFFAAWFFSFGFFLAGLYWVGVAFFAEAERFGALAAPGVLVLCAILATFHATLLAGAKKLFRGGWPLAVSIPAVWVIAEELRGPLITQFPWNPLALALVASDTLMQSVAWFGVTGAGYLLCLAGLLTGQGLLQRKVLSVATGIVVFSALVLSGHLRLTHVANLPGDHETEVRVVQPSIDQKERFDRDLAEKHFFEHIDLSRNAKNPPDILVWPETSVRYQVSESEGVRDWIGSQVSPGGLAIVGGDTFAQTDPLIIHNSVFAVSNTGELEGIYHKVNLVPFGEFMPFRAVFTAVGLRALAVGAVDYSSGEGRRLIRSGSIPSLTPLICFEAVFANESWNKNLERPEWIANITNDAWFGPTSGPYQHLAMARLRSVETGLPLVRAANNGVSVVTDPLGRIIQQLGLYEKGAIQAKLPKRLEKRPLIDQFPSITWIFPVIGLAFSIGILALRRETL